MSSFQSNDPFALNADAAQYVPRRAAELALTALEDHLRRDVPVIALHGPPGIGKSLLLRVLAERCAPPHAAAVLGEASVPGHDPEAGLLSSLDVARADGETPALRLERFVAERHSAGGRVVIGIDDIDALRDDAVARLCRLADRLSPGLTLVVASDHDSVGERLTRLSIPVEAVALTEPMDRSEASSYVRVRMMRAGVPIEARARLDRPALDWVLQGTDGLPSRVNERASEWLASLDAASEHGFDESLPHIAAGATSPDGGGGLVSRGARPLPVPPPSLPIETPPEADDEGRETPEPPGTAAPTDAGAGSEAVGPSSLAGGLRTATAAPSRSAAPPRLAPVDRALEDRFGPQSPAPSSWMRRFGWVLGLAAALAAIVWIRSLDGGPAPDLPPPPAVVEPPPLARPEPAPLPEEIEVEIEAEPVPEVELAAVPPAPAPRVTPRRTPPPTAVQPPEPAPTFVLIDELGTTAAASSYVRVTIDAAAGNRIEVDGELVGDAPIPDLLVAPGVHIFTAHSESGFSVEQVVEVHERTGIIEF